MTKFSNKYRIELNRLPGWDYGGNGMYLITIVTKDRNCLFGKIKNNKIIISDFGDIAQSQWFKSFEIRKELFSDEFILMPNHIHAIIILKKTYDSNDSNVETHGRAFQIDNLIDVNQLKIEKFNKNNRLWQPNYYDHIIRNKNEY